MVHKLAVVVGCDLVRQILVITDSLSTPVQCQFGIGLECRRFNRSVLDDSWRFWLDFRHSIVVLNEFLDQKLSGFLYRLRFLHGLHLLVPSLLADFVLFTLLDRVGALELAHLVLATDRFVQAGNLLEVKLSLLI